MKKLYTQPKTENVRLDSGTVMQSLGAGSDAPEGAWGAPVRNGHHVGKLYI